VAATIQDLAKAEGFTDRFASRVMRLAYLSPDVLDRKPCLAGTLEHTATVTLHHEGGAEGLCPAPDLRNGVLVISTAGSPTVDHKRLTRRELAEFILGKRSLGEVGTIFADFDSYLDRSNLLSAEKAIASVLGEPRERLRTDAYGQQ
jgi:hypothetical protein